MSLSADLDNALHRTEVHQHRHELSRLANMFSKESLREMRKAFNKTDTSGYSDYQVGFYPEITDCLERAENFWSCLTRRRRILGLWRRSMYSNTSDRAASSVGYVVR